MRVDERKAPWDRPVDHALEAAWREVDLEAGGGWRCSTVAVRSRTGSRLVRLLVGILMAAFLVLILILSTGPRPDRRDAGPGRPAPEFALPVVGKTEVYGSADLKGKLVVVTFWASWCEPCGVNARLVEDAWRRYRGEGVAVLGVSLDTNESEALDFVRRHGLTYPNVRDFGTVGSAFRLQGVPEMYFLAENWTINSVYRGFPIGVDERHGSVIQGAIYQPILERRIAGLFATRWEGRPAG